MKTLRPFKFDKPTRLKKVVTKKEYENWPSLENHEKASVVFTDMGMVFVQQIQWETNNEPINFSRFSTMFGNIQHDGWLDEAGLSDNKLKSYAVSFMKQCCLHHRDLLNISPTT
jgi:hypothetical protein